MNLKKSDQGIRSKAIDKKNSKKKEKRKKREREREKKIITYINLEMIEVTIQKPNLLTFINKGKKTNGSFRCSRFLSFVLQGCFPLIFIDIVFNSIKYYEIEQNIELLVSISPSEL